MRAAWHFARLCPRWCHSHRLSRSAADSRSALRVTSLEKAPASGPPAGLGFNSEIALEGFRKLPRRVLSAAGFQRGRKPQGGADGGVDLRLRDRNGLHVVQCKQWLKRPVSVSIVRELYGVMVDQGAYRGSVVTSGTFTEEAEQFAEGKPMELVDGERLERMIREVGGAKAVSSHPPNTPSADRVTECPRCGSPLILRKARRGRQKDRSSMAARRFRNAVMSGPRCEARRSPEHARYARATRSRSIESVAHQRSPRVDLRAGMTPWARARLRDGPWPQACRVGAGASTSACARMADLQASTRRRLV